MKRVGTVVGIAQGVVVVHAGSDDHPDLGTAVIDEQLEPVGRVVDIFGPVDQPYLAVAPRVETGATLVGTPLYARS